MIQLQTADWLSAVPPYVFSKLNEQVKQIELSSGKPVLNLAMGTPTIPPTQNYIKKLKEIISDTETALYPGYVGIPEFTAAVQSWYQEKYGVVLEENEVFPVLGAKDGIMHLTRALVDAGDEVVVPNPGYPAFSSAATLAGGVVVPYQLSAKDSFRLDIIALENTISDKTKLIWINFPSNPTGQVISEDEIQAVVELAREKKVWVVYDHAYSEIVFDEYRSPSIFQVPGAKEVAVELGSFSKTFSFAGYRIGWVVGNSGAIAAVAKLKSQFDSGMSAVWQKLGAYALTNPDEKWNQNMLETYAQRRQQLMAFITELGMTCTLRSGSLYLWAKIPDKWPSDIEYSQYLLTVKNICVAPGSAYGSAGEKYVRVSFCGETDQLERYL